MNYNAFIGAGDGFPTNHSNYGFGHHVTENTGKHNYTPYEELRSQGLRSHEGYFGCGTGQGYNPGTSGGGDANSSFRYGGGGDGPSGVYDSVFDDAGSSRFFNCGSGGGEGSFVGAGRGYGGSGGVSASRGMDMPRAPGAPRPLTSCPSRPLFRPLADTFAPAPPASVLSYGFYGLTPMGPAQSPLPANGRGFTPRHPSSSPSPRSGWLSNGTPTWGAAAVGGCASPLLQHGPSAAVATPSATAANPKRPAWERRPLSPTVRPSASAPTTAVQQQQQNKLQPEKTKTQGAKRASRYPPPKRLLSGTVERVVSWLHLAQSHHLLFEVLGTVLSVSRNSPWIIRLCGSGTGTSPALESSGSRVIGGREREPVLEVSFYEMDLPLPPLRPGQTVRCVGHATGRARIQAFCMRATMPGEMGLAQRLGFVCQHAVKELTADNASNEHTPPVRRC